MPPTLPLPSDLDARRAAARRTAWILGAIAALIFVGFILRGVLAT